MDLVTTFNNWDELYFEMQDLFFNDTRFYSYKPEAYESMVKIVDEIKNNVQKYIDNPEEVDKILEMKDKNFMEWFPYISGGRAALLEMKFFDKEGVELNNISHLSEAIKTNNKEVMENTFIKIYANVSTLNKFTKKPKMKI